MKSVKLLLLIVCFNVMQTSAYAGEGDCFKVPSYCIEHVAKRADNNKAPIAYVTNNCNTPIGVKVCWHDPSKDSGFNCGSAVVENGKTHNFQTFNRNLSGRYNLATIGLKTSNHLLVCGKHLRGTDGDDE